MTLVDSDVLIDILSSDRVWLDWSLSSLQRCSVNGPLIINEIVYTEMSIQLPSQELLDEAVAILNVTMHRTPKEALFLAGKAFRQYRRGRGIRNGVLPDFFIGAHAQIERLPLLTRDPRRYRTYFPGVMLIAPDMSAST